MMHDTTPLIPIAIPAPRDVTEKRAMSSTARSGTSTNSTPQPAAAPAASKGKTVLVVDDERDLVDLVGYNLRRNGYDVITAFDGDQAIEQAAKHVPDLVLLDLMLPGTDGMEVARRLKADGRTARIPIIMMTAKGEETDVVVGLTLGADDYVTKPFSIKVLMARVQTVLRRGDGGGAGASGAAAAPDGEVVKVGPLAIDTARHEVTVNGQPVRLTLTEFKLLNALASARGRVLTRDQLMDKAMGTDVFVTDRAIDVHVTSIRKKLGDANWLVHTVRGVGYRLQESPEE